MSFENSAPSKLKVLVAHCAYQQRGGEDAVVESEVALLRSNGHSVATYFRSNEELRTLSPQGVVRDLFWSKKAALEATELIRSFCPDVLHVHNTFPLISPSIYWAARRLGVPVVQTLHNFRLHCPQAMYLRRGKICEDCKGRVPWRAAVRGCYRDSRLESLGLSSMLAAHRVLGTWNSCVTRYIALNEFCKGKFIEGGLPAKKILIKPNFVDFDLQQEEARDGFLFVGRLSPEKGISLLSYAMKNLPESTLRVAGAGDEIARLEGMTNVILLGSLDGEQVRREMARATALVLPSLWYENFPRTLVEAFACGLPVIASRLGAMQELIKEGVTGILFDPSHPQDLQNKLRWASDNIEQMRSMGRAARNFYEAQYSAEKNYLRLMEIYREAIDET